MDAAMVVSWKLPFPGREKEALDYAREVNEYWGKLATEGKCSPPEIFFSETGGHGLWIIKGDRDTLETLLIGPAEGTGRRLAHAAYCIRERASALSPASPSPP